MTQSHHDRLLIEPLWNWNIKKSQIVEKTGLLLIEPLWNWNHLGFEPRNIFPVLLIEPLWNWNIAATVYFSAPVASFNRTTMELKPTPARLHRLASSAFNRTTMELKHMRCPQNTASGNLLIEPLWNWNYWYGPRAPPSAAPFNRTTMELKRMLARSVISSPQPFNRTTMELKLHILPALHQIPPWLLIEPLWNWNSGEAEREGVGEALLIEPLWNWNSCAAIFQASHTAFNRTTMELKPSRFAQYFSSLNPFNRTTMELKRPPGPVLSRSAWMLLIEPLWNWNVQSQQAMKLNDSAF